MVAQTRAIPLLGGVNLMGARGPIIRLGRLSRVALVPRGGLNYTSRLIIPMTSGVRWLWDNLVTPGINLDGCCWWWKVGCRVLDETRFWLFGFRFGLWMEYWEVYFNLPFLEIFQVSDKIVSNIIMMRNCVEYFLGSIEMKRIEHKQ